MPESESYIATSPASSHDELLRPGKLAIHLLLFAITLGTTTAAGMLWQNEFDIMHFGKGLEYSLALLFILSCHEFGHYFAARFHKVKVTLPYYIPLPPIPGVINFGTLGAVIRTKQPIPTKNALFDIGIAGPIAGFVASILVLGYGFTHLPGPEFLLSIHPDYDFARGVSAGHTGGLMLTFGSTLLYDFMAGWLTPSGAYLPPMTEMYHYPFLVTGWFGLLVTALNLLPAGQLDGGHISYAMFGRMHRYIARITVAALILLGGFGILPGLLDWVGFTEIAIGIIESIPNFESLFWPGWLFWALLILIVVKVDHPPIADDTPLSQRRMLLGWASWAMFFLCFSPAPLFITF